MEETKKLTIPEGYEFDKVENGEVILKKKEVAMPKTWEECYMKVEAKYLSHFRHEFAVPKELVDPIGALCQLLICRNAWWKQLGWKPDYFGNGINLPETHCGNGVIKDFGICGDKRILIFPTEGVRNQFLDTFRDLIEEAKELL